MSILLVIVIIGCVVIGKYRQNNRKLALTTYIHNALVIAIAIGQYDEKRDDIKYEVDGVFQNLDSIDNDIKHIGNIFGVTLNYKIIP